jgi:hypothetical protein
VILQTQQGRALAELRRGFLQVLGEASGQGTIAVSVELVRRWLSVASAALEDVVESDDPLVRVMTRWQRLGADDLAKQVDGIRTVLERCRNRMAHRNEVAAEVGRLEYLVEDRLARAALLNADAARGWREDFDVVKSSVWDALRRIEPFD